MEVFLSLEFKHWLGDLKDFRARRKIVARVNRAAEGNLGQTRSLSAGLSEMKIDEGPGYRLYFTIDGGELVVLLCGGDKSTQSRDIERARSLLKAREWRI